MGDSRIARACRVVMSPWRVERHKYSRQDGSLEHDGFISSVLVLVFIVGFSVTVIISQFLSGKRVEITHQVQPFVTQIFLTLLLIPGVATIAYSFKYWANIKTVVHHPHTMSYSEIIKMAGLYIFASCAIAFDLFSVICEFNCLHGNITDGVIDIVFYISKAMFTLLQCLFISKFLKSCFDSKPFLQVSLVSIIAANMAIWMYTTISEHSSDFFGNIYDRETDPWNDYNNTLNCEDKNLQGFKESILPYFSPFTLEFSLLVFECIIEIWSRMKHLDFTIRVPSDAILDNKELNQLHYDVKGKNDVHKQLKSKLFVTQKRLWLWIEQLYQELTAQFTTQSEDMLVQCSRYNMTLQTTIEALDSTIKKEVIALQDIEELKKLNDCAEVVAPLHNTNNDTIQNMATLHRNHFEQKRMTLRASLQTAWASIVDDATEIDKCKGDLTLEKSRLAQSFNQRGKSSGLGCGIGLLLGLTMFSFEMALIYSCQKSDLIFNSTNCANELFATGVLLDKSKMDITTGAQVGRNEPCVYFRIIKAFRVFVSIILIFVIIYGFKSMLELKSNYHRFRFTDVFYCISSFGFITLLSFSFISSVAVIAPGAKFYIWNMPKNMSNGTMRVLEWQVTCATNEAREYSFVIFVYTITDIIQIFVCSAFVVQAGQMLPHGNISKNKKLSEIIQFLGTTHFFLWIVTSFIYAPNLDRFFFIEELYFGASTFAAIARVTYPFIIFYHFTTAMRCIALFYQYDSFP